jgi:hypothetical protein
VFVTFRRFSKREKKIEKAIMAKCYQYVNLSKGYMVFTVLFSELFNWFFKKDGKNHTPMKV